MKWIFGWLFFPFFLGAVPIQPERAPWPPFISGDAFRAICDYIFDETDTSLNPKTVLPNSAIFVKGDYLDLFFERIHPQLPHPYVLVTHNSDSAAPGPFIPLLGDDKLIAWFAQNVDCAHPKIHPIPIGIANRCWKHGNGSLVEEIRKKRLNRSKVLYLNFAIGTYPEERQQAYHLLSRLPCTYFSSNQSFKKYLKEMASSKFVASPRGNGLDTHRLWESLYLGSYPIVKSSTLDPLYADLPVVIIEDWHQITEKFLVNKYKEMEKKTFKLEKLQFGYWSQLIESCKKGPT